MADISPLATLPPELLAHLSSFLSLPHFLSFLLLERRCFESCQHLLSRRQKEKFLTDLDAYDRATGFQSSEQLSYLSLYYVDNISPSIVAAYPQRLYKGRKVVVAKAIPGHSGIPYTCLFEGVFGVDWQVDTGLTFEEAKRIANSHLQNTSLPFEDVVLIRNGEMVRFMQLPQSLQCEGGTLYSKRGFALWWILFWLLNGLTMECSSGRGLCGRESGLFARMSELYDFFSAVNRDYPSLIWGPICEKEDEERSDESDDEEEDEDETELSWWLRSLECDEVEPQNIALEILMLLHQEERSLRSYLLRNVGKEIMESIDFLASEYAS